MERNLIKNLLLSLVACRPCSQCSCRFMFCWVRVPVMFTMWIFPNELSISNVFQYFCKFASGLWTSLKLLLIFTKWCSRFKLQTLRFTPWVLQFLYNRFPETLINLSPVLLLKTAFENLPRECDHLRHLKPHSKAQKALIELILLYIEIC